MLSANCEGCEFGLLEDLLESVDSHTQAPLITRFHTLQFARHNFKEIPDVVSRYCRISEVCACVRVLAFVCLNVLRARACVVCCSVSAGDTQAHVFVPLDLGVVDLVKVVSSYWCRQAPSYRLLKACVIDNGAMLLNVCL